MLDIDLGQALVSSLLVFVILPLTVAVIATAAIVRLVRNTTRRLAVGLYIMVASVLVTPAPLVWGDVHLAFITSQLLEGYGVLFWMVGAATAVASLVEVLKHRHTVALAVFVIFGAIVLGGRVLSGTVATLLWSTTAFGYACAGDCGDGTPVGVEQAVSLALIPLVGTLAVLLVIWRASR